ncbi:MAG: magnesium transporter [Fimbriimonadaceae bacterium]|nr:magnesium transporter [Fimbriimonadaceae bacterium]
MARWGTGRPGGYRRWGGKRVRIIGNIVDLIRQAGSLGQSRVRSEDLGDALQRVSPEEGAEVLRALRPYEAAQALIDAPTETVRRLLEFIPDETVAAYLDILPMDDAIDLQEEMGMERWERLLTLIPAQDAAEIRRLQAAPRGSVGRLITEAFFRVGPDSTMEAILADLRLANPAKYETINDLYVLDDADRLIGVVSIRRVLRSRPDQTAREVMDPEPISVLRSTSGEEAARTMSRYGFYALPVLDEQGRMVGVLTGDDAQEILQEAETKDVLALGAVSGSAEPYLSLNVWHLYARRMPWLIGLFVAETFTGIVLRHYGQSEEGLNISPLMYFVPLVIGAGGNCGSQVTTTITRALALKEIQPGEWWKVILKELLVALMIGATLGLIGALRASAPAPFGWEQELSMSLLIAFALPAIVVWAATVGSCLPILAQKAGVDPAVMSAPFITTFVDATGLIIYFELAKRLILSQ